MKKVAFLLVLLVAPFLSFAGAERVNDSKAVACAPFLNNAVRAQKIAALLATRELAAKRNAVTVEGQETLQADSYKILIVENSVQIVRQVRVVASGPNSKRPSEWCVEVQEDVQ